MIQDKTRNGENKTIPFDLCSPVCIHSENLMGFWECHRLSWNLRFSGRIPDLYQKVYLCYLCLKQITRLRKSSLTYTIFPQSRNIETIFFVKFHVLLPDLLFMVHCPLYSPNIPSPNILPIYSPLSTIFSQYSESQHTPNLQSTVHYILPIFRVPTYSQFTVHCPLYSPNIPSPNILPIYSPLSTIVSQYSESQHTPNLQSTVHYILPIFRVPTYSQFTVHCPLYSPNIPSPNILPIYSPLSTIFSQYSESQHTPNLQSTVHYILPIFRVPTYSQFTVHCPLYSPNIPSPNILLIYSPLSTIFSQYSESQHTPNLQSTVHYILPIFRVPTYSQFTVHCPLYSPNIPSPNILPIYSPLSTIVSQYSESQHTPNLQSTVHYILPIFRVPTYSQFTVHCPLYSPNIPSPNILPIYSPLSTIFSQYSESKHVHCPLYSPNIPSPNILQFTVHCPLYSPNIPSPNILPIYSPLSTIFSQYSVQTYSQFTVHCPLYSPNIPSPNILPIYSPLSTIFSQYSESILPIYSPLSTIFSQYSESQHTPNLQSTVQYSPNIPSPNILPIYSPLSTIFSQYSESQHTPNLQSTVHYSLPIFRVPTYSQFTVHCPLILPIFRVPTYSQFTVHCPLYSPNIPSVHCPL